MFLRSVMTCAPCSRLFATAIAARLAAGDDAPAAISWAKGFAGRAIGDATDWRIGAGTGPIDQFGWSALTLRAR